jgi:elongation factor P--(R)-beta-lysine ligase
MSPAWHPSATLQALKDRAALTHRLRQFFHGRGVLEVETPSLSAATVTDPHLHSLPVTFHPPGTATPTTLYLQTSPEYAMKRLLAAGSGPIFQISKAFRADPPGPLHNPEFSMLEWYRPGWDHHALMDEMDDLLQTLLGTLPARRVSYADAFFDKTGLNPHTVTDAALATFGQATLPMASPITHRNDWLDLIMSHCIEPDLANDRPAFVYDFPQTQAALAKIRHDENPPVASRFEVYFQGIELANGFHELQDAGEQRRRFENDLATRRQLALPPLPLDEHFLAALESGLPDCAGVALGIDRLVMLAQQRQRLSEVLGFDFERA